MVWKAGGTAAVNADDDEGGGARRVPAPPGRIVSGAQAAIDGGWPVCYVREGEGKLRDEVISRGGTAPWRSACIYLREIEMASEVPARSGLNAYEMLSIKVLVSW